MTVSDVFICGTIDDRLNSNTKLYTDYQIFNIKAKSVYMYTRPPLNYCLNIICVTKLKKNSLKPIVNHQERFFANHSSEFEQKLEINYSTINNSSFPSHLLEIKQVSNLCLYEIRYICVNIFEKHKPNPLFVKFSL